jgi:hypothetical protein
MTTTLRRPGERRGPGTLMVILDSGFRRNDDDECFRAAGMTTTLRRPGERRDPGTLTVILDSGFRPYALT